MIEGDKRLTRDNAEEYSQAVLYRHYGAVFEQNDRGVIKDQFGAVAETVRSRLFVGLGAGVLILSLGIISGEQFIMGVGFVPVVVFGGKLLVRWKAATDARKKQFEILAWFKEKGIPFPYENAREIINPMERMDWEDAQRDERLTAAALDAVDRNWETAVGIAGKMPGALNAIGKKRLEAARWETDVLAKQGLLQPLLAEPKRFGLDLEDVEAVLPLLFFDWEARPAIMRGFYKAWAVVRGGGEWVPVQVIEVIDSGRQISAKDFGEVFPDVPPLSYTS